MKKYLVLFVLLLSTVTICSFNYKIETIENNSMIVSEDYLKDLIFDMIQIFVQNRGDIVVNEKSNKFDFLIKTGYISDGDVILINFTLYNKIKSRLNDVSYTIPIKSDFLHSIRVSLNQLVSIEPKIKKSTNDIPQKIVNIQSQILKKSNPEYRILFSIGASYGGMGFFTKSQTYSYNFDISSPRNRWRDSFAPFFRFEYANKFNLNFHGVFLEMIVPIIFEYDRFFSYSKTKAGYFFGYREIFSVYTGFENLFIIYNKYSKYNELNVNVFLLTFGLTFDIDFIALDGRLLISGGFSLYPPQLWNESLPLQGVINIQVSNDYNKYNYLFPVTPRFGFTLFNKQKDLGLSFQYGLIVMDVNYDTNFYLFNTNNDLNIKYDAGNETVFISDIKIGIVYKKNVK
ncbi:MAG: hypothetical protein A2015_12415 [Spirochaetes bacterium GWF1_31_7]|nr:MAG: hypothetical protein A2Y30_09360 [Spirochaetes bacterium GWE1_32_154]OHD48995.1 MAG: hypothetical protein A2Y29_17130 [Spirochaetes bacterium GWE2_31_10]OHD49565.1 MAG: hypothetical protein A2015_12415 [Spirochaetes bacterium GWF1_31_7]HBD95909.1 hypothetical protein [Spirochaetia bacterium]HBI36735.1 hypothetical protein [Spirochaetia bacterium]